MSAPAPGHVLHAAFHLAAVSLLASARNSSSGTANYDNAGKSHAWETAGQGAHQDFRTRKVDGNLRRELAQV